MYLLGQSSHVSDMAPVKGTHTAMHVLKKKWRKEDPKTFDRISELISNIDIPEFDNTFGRKCYMTL